MKAYLCHSKKYLFILIVLGMLIIVLCMFGGIVSGYLLRRWRFSFINRVIVTLVWLLLFMLGVELGLNEVVLSEFGRLGVEALLIAAFGTLGSVAGALVLWRRVQRVSGKS